MTDTIGSQLKQARQARNLSIDKVAQATRIRSRYLSALEADDPDALPSPAQARGFLRIYAGYLGISLGQPSNLTGQDSAADHPSSPLGAAAASGASTGQPGPETAPSRASRGGSRPSTKKTTHPPAEVSQAETAPAPSQGAPAEAEDASALPSAQQTGPIPSAANPASQMIFASIGRSLRERREALSITLEEIQEHTHVRRHYLEALESGSFDRLPSSVQARGMLANYARFLDLDMDGLLLQFAEGLQAQRLERQPVAVGKEAPSSEQPETGPKPSFPGRLSRYFSMDILVGGGLVVLLTLFAIWGTSQIVRLHGQSTPPPTVPGLSSLLLPTASSTLPAVLLPETATSSAIALPGGSSLTAVASLPTAIAGQVQVIVIANRSGWVRVTVDGQVKMEGLTTAGTAYPFNGIQQIEVVTGDGSSVSILYNQSNLGNMGTMGQVVDRIYTPSAVLNPTATFTPSPTISPTPTVTPRPSSTPRASATPLATALQGP
jgi:cytoskeletal protein RodZ